jgi:hypothetical protein
VATNGRTSDVELILLAHKKTSSDSHETLGVTAGYFGTNSRRFELKKDRARWRWLVITVQFRNGHGFNGPSAYNTNSCVARTNMFCDLRGRMGVGI